MLLWRCVVLLLGHSVVVALCHLLLWRSVVALCLCVLLLLWRYVTVALCPFVVCRYVEWHCVELHIDKELCCSTVHFLMW